MSWLFGKKKHHKDSPPDSTDEHAPAGSDDGFVTIERSDTLMPSNPGLSSNPYIDNLYPNVPGLPSYPSMIPTNIPKQNQQGEQQHYLSNVPFKLCKQLQSTLDSDIDTDMLRISEILSFIEQIESQSYDYDFALENSVIAELSSRHDE